VFFESEPDLQVATLCFRLNNDEILNDPNVVKVVFDQKGHALYFSRAPIPYDCDKNQRSDTCFKHFGIYAYRRDFLLRYTNMPKSSLEETEKLEQLRILESGEKIKVLEAKRDSLGIDTEEDLRQAEEILKAKV